ncbi:hypothetical protein DFP72DRAFT_890955 [Ephemerocybe angulata]|uniref:Protein kinase domain-containing protein n=1 Tax=Ephemerocybe angulata TaxID=980116 RepID=A0A8H6MAT0_9AGAR|nr:hypothetical protein DFP72DRAFT_890955 [Tulosesus angulatus]
MQSLTAAGRSNSPEVVSETPQCEENCLHSYELIHPNIAQVHRDLQNTQPILLPNLLKSMIMLKYNREDRHSDGDPMTAKELSDYGDNQLRILVEEAVAFCNDASRSEQLTKKLEEISEDISKSRSHKSLSTALNSILIDFQSRDVGQLKRCRPEDLTLYNSSANISMNSKFLLETYFGLPFEELTNLMEAGGPKSSSNSESSCKTDWSDFVSCIEVTKDHGDRKANLRQNWKRHRYTSQHLLGSVSTLHRTSPPPSGRSSSTQVSSSSPPMPESGPESAPGARGVLKRVQEGEDTDNEHLLKRLKTSSFSECDIPPLAPMHPGMLPAEVQCAFFGLELLRSRWDRTHSIVMLLAGDQFSIQWHDSQGCIRSQAVNVYGEELPSLVATIILLQRFQTLMRGRAGVQLQVNIDGVGIPFTVPEGIRARWEAHGRRPVAVRPVSLAEASAIPVSTAAPSQDRALDTRLDDYFFKWYWRESTRHSEKHIVDTAKLRAEMYLPKGHASDVANYLPEIHSSEDFDSLSTRHIREYVQLDPTGWRVPCAMLSGRLLSMESTFKPHEVQAQIWDILRCLTLLWALGISHGDISFQNIMSTVPTRDGTKRMVLNDFDLAVIMNPGDESPTENSGATGTRPFMALDVLDNPDGNIKCLRQDIESTLWSLVWYCCRMPEWNEGTYQEVHALKMGWILQGEFQNPRQGVEEKYRPLLEDIGWVLHTEGAELYKLRSKMLRGLSRLDVPAGKSPKVARSAKNFLETCERFFARSEDYKSWPWMDFVVKT